MTFRAEPIDHAAHLGGRVRRKFSAEVRPRSEAQRTRSTVLAAVVGLAGAAGFTVLLIDVLQHDGATLLDPSIQRRSRRCGPPRSRRSSSCSRWWSGRSACR
jgi:hypothetical protein